jgi:predicted Zn-dependent peptidase
MESVLRPIYNPVDVNQEKTNVLNEVAQKVSHSNTKLFDKLNELLFDRPFWQTGGSREDVLRTTPEHLQQFRNLAYAPTNLVTVVSGNVNPNEVFHILAPGFGANPPRYSPLGARTIRLALQPGEVRSANIIDPKLANSKINIGFPAPSQTSFTERIALEFLKEILDGDSLSLLPDQLINQQQLASSIHTEIKTFKQTGLFLVALDTIPGREQTTLANTLNVIQQLSQGLVSDQKIEQVRERLMHRFMAQQNNIDAITKQLGEAAIGNTLPYYLNYMQLASLVTAEDLMAVARKYLSPNRFAVVFGLPPGIGGTRS